MMNDSALNKICIYGVGGVGGYFGCKIANAINSMSEKKYESYFIARGDHLKTIKSSGIRVISPEKTIVGEPTKATDDINDVPAPDLFFLCVKSYDLKEVVKSISSQVSERTVIVPLLNGADIYDRIRTDLSDGIVLPACVFVGTHIQKAGVISQSGGDGKILIGKDPKFSNYSADNVVRVFDDMGINYQWSDDPLPAIWSKYIFIASFGLVTVFTGKTLGEIMEDRQAKQLIKEIMQEIYSIAKGKGIELPSDIIEASINKANNFPFDTKTSYQRDVETKGNINEGDLYGGTITKEGHALGIPTPVTKSIYTEIQNKLKG